MPVQQLHERKDIVAGEIPLGHRKIESQALAEWGDSDSPGDREPVVAVPTVMNGGLPLGGPRAAHHGLQHEAGLIDKDEGAALTPGFL